jgi:hypothetical protein
MQERCACKADNGCCEVLAAAKKRRNERMIASLLIDSPLSKSARAEVDQKYMATSDHPLLPYTPSSSQELFSIQQASKLVWDIC